MLLLKDQPTTLYGVSFTAIFERFAYYALHCTLVLFLIQHFVFDKQQAYELFGAFTAFMYLMTPVGGYCADKWLGVDCAVMVGAFLLGVGYALMGLASHLSCFYVGLATIAIGNGFFQPTIAMSVGRLYHGVGQKRDFGFLVFYAAINIGAVVPPIVVSFLFKTASWQSIYVCSASLVFLSMIIFSCYGRKSTTPVLFTNFNMKRLFFLLVMVGVLLPMTDFAFHIPHMANVFLLIVAAIFVLYVFLQALKFTGSERNNLMACLFLIVFSVLFWALYQQKAMSLLLFTKYNVNRSLFHHALAPELFLALNPFLIIVLTPLVAKLWAYLASKDIEPGVVLKFSAAMLLVGLGFLLLPIGMHFVDAAGKISMYWLVSSYALITLGELFLSPIGLSMITVYTPNVMRGVMMGLWYLASAAAFSLSGFISDWTIPVSRHQIAMDGYTHVFLLLGAVAVISGVLLALFSRRFQFSVLAS